jgi:isopentenyldiphosphate isomerase
MEQEKEEQLDILNEQGDKTGEIKGYNEVHQLGLLHRTIHVWLLNSEGKLLLQKRTKNKRIFPLQWDVSIGGHVSAGQTAIEGSQMEAREELGLDLKPEDFKYLFTVKEDSKTTFNGVGWFEKGFNEVYLVHLDLDISGFKLAPDEVSEVRWIDQIDFRKWVDGEGESIVPHTEEHNKLLEYLDKNSL